MITMEENRSLWLRKLGLKMFNQEDSTLANAYRYLARELKTGVMFLYLKDACEDDYLLYLNNGRTSLYSLKDNHNLYFQQIISKALQAQSYCAIDNFIIAPLSSSKYDRFGFLLFENINFVLSQEIQLAIKSFSEILSSELMGGFLRSTNKTIMEVEDITLRYSDSDEHNVVDHVSLKINEGELTLIMGKSGCGKSSLLNIMAGLLKPNGGVVLYKDKNICEMKEKEKNLFRKNELGYIFQNYNLINELSAAENVKVASLLSKKSSSVKEALKLVGLEKYGNYHPNQMSGGMQQRVAIARALVKNASILLCDEPTGALDSENGKLVMSILQNIAHDKNIPVVVVSHNPDYSLLADHYILLKDGRIQEEYYNPFPFDSKKVL